MDSYLHAWHSKQNEKNDTSLPRRRFYWLNGVGGQTWRIFIFHGWNLIFFLQGLKLKVHYITGAKNTINPIGFYANYVFRLICVHHRSMIDLWLLLYFSIDDCFMAWLFLFIFKIDVFFVWPCSSILLFDQSMHTIYIF